VNSLRKVFSVGFSIITLLFVLSSFILIVFAVLELWSGINPLQTTDLRARFNSIMESVGLLTIAVASLELGQTILDEEVLRSSEMSFPTRVRRFLSRFLIVIIVSLSIEFLVVVFELIHDDPLHLPQASAVGLATAALLAAWGIFIRLNKSAEELEPEAMQEVKGEDIKIKGDEVNS
jgi:magnesium-transporting ATPase (P-type)